METNIYLDNLLIGTFEGLQKFDIYQKAKILTSKAIVESTNIQYEEGKPVQSVYFRNMKNMKIEN